MSKGLTCKHVNLNLDLQHPHQKAHSVTSLGLVLGTVAEIGQSLGLTG